MMDFILSLLNTNFATVIATIVTLALAAFTYYYALPAISERNTLREQLLTQTSERGDNQVELMAGELSQVTKQLESLHTMLAEMQASAATTSRAEGHAQAELCTLIDELRQQVQLLATRVVSLSNSVNVALSSPSAQRAQRGQDSTPVRGLR